MLLQVEDIAEAYNDHVALWQAARAVGDQPAIASGLRRPDAAPPQSAAWVLRVRAESGNIECVVPFALSRSGNLPWRNPADWELSMDQGLTYRPRHKDRGRWYLVEAGALEAASRDRLPGPSSLKMAPGDDAATVIAAIKALPDEQARLVKFFGKAGLRRGGAPGAVSRPGWIADDEPPRPMLWENGEVKVVRHTGRARKKRNVPPFCPLLWPIDLETICASHAVYSTWHAGMTRLVEMLYGKLSLCHDIWFSAPAAPWDKTVKNLLD